MINFKYSTRFIIILNNKVVKIPLSRRGYLQGVNEKKIWNKYQNILPLAKLKWSYLGIVCQKRYETVTSIPNILVRRIKSKVPEFDFDNCDLYNPENWGTDGNQYILLDYGVNSYIASLY
jgi:hypothetical protein